MKTSSTQKISTLIALTIASTLGVQAGPKNPANHGIDGKGSAMREEALLDKQDTHGLFGFWGKDQRPKELQVYHIQTFKRIRGLLMNGKLTEEQGSTFKNRHEEITADSIAKRENGLTDEEKTALRAQLDQLNDDINGVVQKADTGNQRTPLLNRKEHSMEERIQFGERSGRLSKGEAATMRRKLERIQSMEERLKKGDLSTRERERLHKEMNEVLVELHKELRDG